LHSTTPILKTASYVRKALHIVSTTFLAGNEVLVGFSDGTGAIYEAEELEKLRPTPKLTVADHNAHKNAVIESAAELPAEDDEELYVA
jgi:hypothetical protein